MIMSRHGGTGANPGPRDVFVFARGREPGLPPAGPRHPPRTPAGAVERLTGATDLTRSRTEHLHHAPCAVGHMAGFVDAASADRTGMGASKGRVRWTFVSRRAEPAQNDPARTGAADMDCDGLR